MRKMPRFSSSAISLLKTIDTDIVGKLKLRKKLASPMHKRNKVPHSLKNVFKKRRLKGFILFKIYNILITFSLGNRLNDVAP